MRDDNRLARKLFGTAKKIAEALEAYGATTTVEATAMADSDGGYVLVDMGGATVSDDELETDEGVDEVDPDDPEWDVFASDQNLAPILDADPDDAGSWVSLEVGIEPLDEGWSRVTYDNSNGAQATVDASTPTVGPIEDGKTYTLLLEVRPHMSSDEGSEDEADGTGIDPDDVYDDIDNQVAADETEPEGENGDEGADNYTPVASIVPTTSGSQFEATNAITLDEQTTYIALTATSGGTSLLGTQFVVDAGEVMDVEVRMSLYEGDYDGDYVPYGMREGGSWQLVPCSANIKAGDTVQVTIKNGAPIDATSTGWGDVVATVASQAEAIATATGQHFWADDNGIHVSTDDNDAEGANNILINSLGILLREYANVLLELSSAGVIVGDQSDTHLSVDSDSVDVLDGNGDKLLEMSVDGSGRSRIIAAIPSGGNNKVLRIGAGTSGVDHGDAQLYLESRKSASEPSSAMIAAYSTTGLLSEDASIELYSASSGNTAHINMTTSSIQVNEAAPIVYEDKTVTVTSTAHGTNFMTSVSVAKTGYTPIGVVDWWWPSGTRQNFFNAWGVFTYGTTLYVRLCNLHSSDAASGSFTARVMYVKDELL